MVDAPGLMFTQCITSTKISLFAGNHVEKTSAISGLIRIRHPAKVAFIGFAKYHKF